jgi:hypothetical protein
MLMVKDLIPDLERGNRVKEMIDNALRFIRTPVVPWIAWQDTISSGSAFTSIGTASAFTGNWATNALVEQYNQAFQSINNGNFNSGLQGGL